MDEIGYHRPSKSTFGANKGKIKSPHLPVPFDFLVLKTTLKVPLHFYNHGKLNNNEFAVCSSCYCFASKGTF